MANCVIKFNGKVVSEEQFLEYIEKQKEIIDFLNKKPKFLESIKGEFPDERSIKRQDASITTSNYTRKTVKDNPDTAFVFTENTHSITAFPNRQGEGSAIIRPESNAFAIVTKKKYDYNTKENIDYADTEEDFEEFKKVNTELIEKLKNSDKLKIVFPQGFATDKAKLPTRFAEWLQKELYENFGLITELNKNKTGLISKEIEDITKAQDIPDAKAIQEYSEYRMANPKSKMGTKKELERFGEFLKNKRYGEEQTEEEKNIEKGVNRARREYKLSLLDHPVMQRELRDRGLSTNYADSRVRSAVDEILVKKADLLPKFNEEQVRKNLEAYAEGRVSDVIPITKGEADNILLQLQQGLLHNEQNEEITRTPATRAIFEQLRQLFIDLGIYKDTISEPFSPANKSRLETANFTGQDNIAISASFNVVFQYFAGRKFTRENLKLFGEDGFNVEIDENGWILDAKGRRINDFISQYITAMTDAGTHDDPAFFHITKDTLSILNLALAAGKTAEFGIFLINQPIVKDYIKALARNENNLTRGSYKSKNEIYQNVTYKHGINAKTKEVRTNDLSIEELEDLLMNNINSPTPDVQLYALDSVMEALEIAQEMIQLTQVLGLLKGRGSSFTEVAETQQTIRNIMKDSFLFNMKEVIEDNPHLSALIKSFEAAEEVDSKFFTLERPVYRELLRAIEGNLNPISMRANNGVSKMRRQLLSYLTMKAVRKAIPQTIGMNILFTPDLQRDIKTLSADRRFLSNAFLRMLNPEGTVEFKAGNFAGRVHYPLRMNTRSALEPNTAESVIDAFTEILYHEDKFARSVAERMLEYLLIKDGYLFRNNSFINMIEPQILKEAGIFDVTNSMREGFEGTKEDFERVFGMSEKQLKTEFILAFLQYSGNKALLNRVAKRGGIEVWDTVVRITKKSYKIGEINGFKDNGKEAKYRYSVPFAISVVNNSNLFVVSEIVRGKLKIKGKELENRITELMDEDGLLQVDEVEYTAVNTQGSKEIFTYYLTQEELREFNKESANINIERAKQEAAERKKEEAERKAARNKQRGIKTEEEIEEDSLVEEENTDTQTRGTKLRDIVYEKGERKNSKRKPQKGDDLADVKPPDPDAIGQAFESNEATTEYKSIKGENRIDFIAKVAAHITEMFPNYVSFENKRGAKLLGEMTRTGVRAEPWIAVFNHPELLYQKFGELLIDWNGKKVKFKEVKNIQDDLGFAALAMLSKKEVSAKSIQEIAEEYEYYKKCNNGKLS